MNGNNHKPKVTVLMAVYNGEKYLEETVKSVLEQTYTDFEFLILNDGSTDNTQSILRSLQDSRIRIVNYEKNRGVINVLNKGIDLIEGEYTARMDADDICMIDRLEKEVAFLDKNPDVSVVASHVSLINEKGKDKGSWQDDIKNKTEQDIARTVARENCIANPTVMIRSSILKKYRYNGRQKNSEDWDLWMRLISRKQRIAKLPEVLVQYRLHPDSVTARSGKKGIFLNNASVLWCYCVGELKEFRFNAFNLKALYYSLSNRLQYCLQWLPVNLFSGIRQIMRTNIFRVWKQYRGLHKLCSTAPGPGRAVFFFFPYYHTGGAEKVHAAIMEAIADKKPVTFITSVSAGKGMYHEFCKYSNLLEINLIFDYPVLHRQVKKMLLEYINRHENPLVFGCNCYYYYRFIPYLDNHVKCVDLIHAFVNRGEPGPEYWSLPVVERLNARVVIVKKTILDLQLLYKEEDKDTALLERIHYIPNAVNVPETYSKPFNSTLSIIYVGRSSAEKRVQLVAKIARATKEKGIEAEFIIVGKMDRPLTDEDLKGCIMKGEITDQQAMNRIYEKADLLLITSSREGFPLVIMEAMAFGVVPVCTAVGGIPEHLVSNENGILINSQQEDAIIEDFVHAISELSARRNKLKELSVNAAEYARNTWSKENFVNSYRQLLLS